MAQKLGASRLQWHWIDVDIFFDCEEEDWWHALETGMFAQGWDVERHRADWMIREVWGTPVPGEVHT